jgi:CBS domain-containing protein
MLRVQNIMTRDIVKLAPEATIREAMETLSTNHLSGAPVVSGERVVGVVSITDILGFIISAPEPGPPDPGDSTADSWEAPDQELEDEDDVDATGLSEDIWEDWTQCSETRIDDASPEGDKLLDQRTVEEVMNHELFCLPPTASVRAAATMMRDRGIHRVLVMEGGSLKGIVSALDIARAVSEQGVAGIKVLPVSDEPSPWITS